MLGVGCSLRPVGFCHGGDVRSVDELIDSANRVIHRAYMHAPHATMAPLFSGGHDSMVACHLASQHKLFRGEVFHINTGIGARYTADFVTRTCDKLGWKLTTFKSPETYEKFVRERGFPGPGRHHWVYVRLKDRCVRKVVNRRKRLLITGCRKAESVRRMGHVEPVKIGELVWKKCEDCKDAGRRAAECPTGKCKRVCVNLNRIWVAPCHDWSKAEQQLYMDEFGLPVNRLKVALGMSGECFCGAFAQPGELDLIRKHAPDVAEEIDRLAEIARECGKPAEWGKRPAGTVTVEETGPLCNACDQRADACGVVIDSE